MSDGYALVFNTVRLRNPSHVCLPVDLHGIDPGAPSSADALVCYREHADLPALNFFVMSENVSSDDGSTSTVPNGASFVHLREYCIPSSVR
jgi:hypothetical protein